MRFMLEFVQLGNAKTLRFYGARKQNRVCQLLKYAAGEHLMLELISRFKNVRGSGELWRNFVRATCRYKLENASS